MFKTNSRKGIASAAVAALAFAGLIAATPAQAAVGLNLDVNADDKVLSVVPSDNYITLKAYTDGIPTDLIQNIKYELTGPGGVTISARVAATAPDAAFSKSGSVSAVLGTSETKDVQDDSATGANGSSYITLVYGDGEISASSTVVTVTAFISVGGSEDPSISTYKVSKEITFLKHSDVKLQAALDAPKIGDGFISGYLTSSNVNLSAIQADNTIGYKVSQAVSASPTLSTASDTVTAAWDATDERFQASTSGNAAAFNLLAITSASDLVQAGDIFAVQAYFGNSGEVLAKGDQVTYNVANKTYTAIEGISVSATATNTKNSGAAVTVNPNATSVVSTVRAVDASGSAVANVPVSFKVAENSANSLDAAAVLTFGAKTLKNTNGGTVQSATIEVVTDAKGLATLTIAIAGVKKTNAIVVSATAPGGSAQTNNMVYTFTENTAASVAVTDMVDVDGTIAPQLNVVKNTSFALNFAVLDTFGALLNEGNHTVYLTDGTSAVQAGVSAGKATVTWPGFSTDGVKTLTARVYKSGDRVGSFEQALRVVVGTAGTPASITQTATGLGTAAAPAVALTTKAWTNADIRLGTSATTGLNGGLALTGRVLDASNNAVAGADVTLTGTNLYFSVAGVLYTTGAVTVKTDASGVYTVTAYSQKAGLQTVSITSGAATKLVDMYFVAAAASAGASISIEGPATVVPGSTVRVTIKLVDAFGNPVKADNTSTEDFSVKVTGPGFVGTLPSATDKNGEAQASVLLGSADTGSLTFTVSYDGDGTGATYAEVAASKTLTVGSAPASSADQKLTVGTFNGYIAIYAKGYEGQKLSAKVAGKWLSVEELSSFERVVRKTGAGYSIKVDLYIDGVFAQSSTTVTK